MRFASDRWSGNVVVIAALAAPFDQGSAPLRARNGVRCREIIERRAFDRVLATQRSSIPLRVEHGGPPLAETRDGSLHLHVTRRGLAFTARLDGSRRECAEILDAIDNGNARSVSISFGVEDDGQHWSYPNTDLPLRYVTDVEFLSDVSIVRRPAYHTTSVEILTVKSRIGKNPQHAGTVALCRRRLELLNAA